MVQHAEATSGRAVARRALIVVGVTAAVTVLLLFLWYARSVLLLAFAGLLLGVFLRRLARLVSDHTPVSSTWALAIVVLLLVALLVGTFWLRGDAIGAQVDTLREQLPQAADQLRQRVSRYEWGQRLIEELPRAETLLPRDGDAIARVTGVVSSTVSMLVNVLVILFLGLVLAGAPSPYVRGLLALVPKSREPRVRDVLGQVYQTLWWWLLGRLTSMAFIGVITGVGLWLMDMPLALVLAVLAALLSFIPNLGPILSFLPAGLLAFVQGPQQLLWVAALYAAVQVVESYLLAPVIDRKTVYLPPALTVTAQLVMALVGGLMGVALATPLTAVIVVLVTTFYVQDVLGRRDVRVAQHGSESSHSAR